MLRAVVRGSALGAKPTHGVELLDVSIRQFHIGVVTAHTPTTQQPRQRYQERSAGRWRIHNHCHRRRGLIDRRSPCPECLPCDRFRPSLSRPDVALVRLESFVEQATILESVPDANTLDTSAAYWERRSEALDALGWASEAAESRARVLVIRTRIAEMGNG